MRAHSLAQPMWGESRRDKREDREIRHHSKGQTAEYDKETPGDADERCGDQIRKNKGSGRRTCAVNPSQQDAT